jgi:hypothetical protein
MPKIGRPRDEVVFTDDERAALLRLPKRARVNRPVAFRARIVLACVDAPDTAVARLRGRNYAFFSFNDDEFGSHGHQGDDDFGSGFIGHITDAYIEGGQFPATADRICCRDSLRHREATRRREAPSRKQRDAGRTALAGTAKPTKRGPREKR